MNRSLLLLDHIPGSERCTQGEPNRIRVRTVSPADRSAAVCDQIGKGLGERAPSIGVVQKAVGRLTRGEILVRVERGEYHVQDDLFLEWLKRPT
jgi:hypothetical protein